ncbi:unnamed protein product [Brassica napus]|uniref:(rape) hypothetical protein n=1 Tax=Brassica napus TaxID=3708 RepID=A0A816IIP2_BRANA|nr:unnamed protein product [Brassica napus]
MTLPLMLNLLFLFPSFVSAQSLPICVIPLYYHCLTSDIFETEGQRSGGSMEKREAVERLMHRRFPETSWRKVSARWNCHQALVEVAVKQYIPPPGTFGGACSTPSKAKFMVQIKKLPLRPDFSIQNHYIQNIGEITMSYRLSSVGSIYV